MGTVSGDACETHDLYHNCKGYEELAEQQKAAKLQQVGGSHYIKYAIQPWDIIDCYGLSFYEGSALKYLLRYRDKNGIEDLRKARHYIDKLIEEAEGIE